MSTDQPDLPPTGSPTVGGGRFRVGQLLANEELTAVFGAWDLMVREWCAVRVLRAEHAHNPELRQRFWEVASAASALDHRHVVKTTAVGDPSAPAYQVMEACLGGTLRDWLGARGPMAPRMAVDVALQVCKGLAAGHDAGLVHGALSVRSLVLTRRGVCKVADFGLIRALRGQPPALPGDDVAALALALWALLTGREASSKAEVDPAALPASLGTPLAEALAADAARRPDVRGMAVALQQARADLPPIPIDTPPLALRREELPSAPHDRDSQRHLAALLEEAGRPILRATLPRADRRDDLRSTPALGNEQIHAYLVDNDLSLLAVTNPLLPSRASGENAQWTTTVDLARKPPGSLPPFPRTRADLMGAPGWTVGVALGLAALVALLAGGLWLRGLHVAAQEVEDSRRELVAEIREEKGPLADDFAALGAPTEPVVAAFERALEAMRDGEEVATADRLVAEMGRELERVGASAVNTPTFGRYRSAGRRLQQMEEEARRHEEALEVWDRASRSTRMSVAWVLGVAPESPVD